MSIIGKEEQTNVYQTHPLFHTGKCFLFNYIKLNYIKLKLFYYLNLKQKCFYKESEAFFTKMFLCVKLQYVVITYLQGIETFC